MGDISGMTGSYDQLWLMCFFVANAAAFIVMLWDKQRAKKTGAKRISEGILFFMATMFGSIGVYLGMFAFRHKTHKWYFMIGIPMLIFENLAFLYCASSVF